MIYTSWVGILLLVIFKIWSVQCSVPFQITELESVMIYRLLFIYCYLMEIVQNQRKLLKMLTIQGPLWKLTKICNKWSWENILHCTSFIHNSCVWHSCVKGHARLSLHSLNWFYVPEAYLEIPFTAKELLPHSGTAWNAVSCPISPAHSLYYLQGREIGCAPLN